MTIIGFPPNEDHLCPVCRELPISRCDEASGVRLCAECCDARFPGESAPPPEVRHFWDPQVCADCGQQFGSEVRRTRYRGDLPPVEHCTSCKQRRKEEEEWWTEEVAKLTPAVAAVVAQKPAARVNPGSWQGPGRPRHFVSREDCPSTLSEAAAELRRRNRTVSRYGLADLLGEWGRDRPHDYGRFSDCAESTVRTWLSRWKIDFDREVAAT